jgi:hypothetical protein
VSEPVPYTEDEAREAHLWVGRHGPANAWTASNGTAARMIGRLLAERDRLRAEIARLRLTDAEREAIDMFASIAWTAVNWDVVARRAATLRGLLARTGTAEANAAGATPEGYRKTINPDNFDNLD